VGGGGGGWGGGGGGGSLTGEGRAATIEKSQISDREEIVTRFPEVWDESAQGSRGC